MNKLIYITILTVLIACDNVNVHLAQNKETKDTISEAVIESVYDSAYAKYAGVYESPFNKYGISFGEVTIKYITINEVEFNIVTAHKQGSTGQIDGKAKIDKNGFATFSAYDCKKLTFQFSENQLEIEEDECRYHGIRSYFTGTYKKL